MEKMNYNYTAYYDTEEERIKAVTEDILREYPNLGELAKRAAELETPFGQVHEDYQGFDQENNEINRLIDIIMLTEEKPEFKAEYDKAIASIFESYRKWQQGFTYANPNEQPAYVVMETLKGHLENPRIFLITYQEAINELKRKYQEKQNQRQYEYDHTMQYNYTAYYDTEEERIAAIVEDMKREYPRLGELLVEAAKMETPFGQVHEDYDQFSSQENHMNRLIDIIILTEDKPEFIEEYKKACEQFMDYFNSWRHCFTYGNPEEQTAYLVGKRFMEHQYNKDLPLLTFKEAEELKKAPAPSI